MKKKQRILAFVLAIILFISNNGNIVLANENSIPETSTSIVGDENLTVEGTNSFGSLFSDLLESEMDEQEENNGCNIFSVEMHDTVAVVSFETTGYATLLVAIYDDTGISMKATGSLEVMPEETTAYVEIDTESMPEYFYIRAFLIDEETMRPLCSAYTSTMYTQEMQEFLSKTTDDFDEDKVLNFDEDKTNNFAVYSDETIIIPESDEHNKVITSDEENNTYIIENIDTYISSLQTGDIFAYEYGEGNILIVKVDAISINGTTATIIGVETTIEEVFDYVKIDETSDSQDVTVDESTCGEGVTYEGDVEVEDDVDVPQIYAIEESTSIKLAKKFSLEKELEKDVKLSGTIEFEVTASIKLYIAKDNQYIEVKLDYKAKAALSFSGKSVEKGLPIAYFEISPMPGVYIKFIPSVMTEVSAKVEVNAQLYGTVGARGSTKEGVKNLTTKPKFKAELKGEITVFIGISMNPKITIATDKFANASLEVTVGGEAKGTTVYSTESDINSDMQKIHDCILCIDGDIYAKATVKFKATIFDSAKLTFEMKETLSIKINDFYYSFDNGGFDFTTCPFYNYKVIFNVKGDLNKKNLSGARITVEGAEITTITEDGKREDVSWITTDENGKAEGYLPAGKYNATIEVVGFNSEKRKFTIEDEPVSIVTFMDLYQDEEDDGADDNENDDSNWWEDDNNGEDGNDEDVEIITEERNTFILYDDTVGVIKEDESLYMWGKNTYGQVGNGTQENQLLPIKILDNVEEITLCSGTTGAITKDGSLYMWGDNRYGQVGNGTQENQLIPVKVLENVIKVIRDGYTVGAITEDGSLYMWGDNADGQIGNGSKGVSQITPIKVMDNVVQVSATNSTVGAITEDGSLYMWGHNGYGRIGNGTSGWGQVTPVKVMDNVVQVSVNYDTVGAITEDGSLYMWGYNADGTVGNGMKETYQKIPIKVLNNVVCISGNYDTVGAITEDGSLYMWGENRYGQVGNGTTKDQLTPIKVLNDIVQISIGHYGVGAITADGSLYVWGSDVEEQLNPQKVLDNVVYVKMSYAKGAITRDGSLYMWGGNWAGQVGNGTTKDPRFEELTPIRVLNNVIQVKLGYENTGAITKDGSLYIWGDNTDGTVGNGTTEDQLTPLKIVDNIKLSTSTQTTDVELAVAEAYCYSAYTTRNTTQQADYTDLLPNTAYNFYVMADRSVQTPLGSENLLYITQAVTDEVGNLSISYEPTQVVDDPNIFIVQMTQINLSSAQVDLQDLEYTGDLQYVHPTVTLDDTVLTEGKDYELMGDYSALEAGKYTVTIHGIGMYTGEISVTYKVLGDVPFASVSGTVSSASTNTENDAVTLELLDTTGAVAYTTTIDGNSTTYLFDYVEAGTYTLRISKANHATREYTIEVNDTDITQDVKICLLGDVSGDGKVTAADYSRLLAHVKKTSAITDAYALLCADVTGEGRITIADYSRLLAHVKKVSLLW